MVLLLLLVLVFSTRCWLVMLTLHVQVVLEGTWAGDGRSHCHWSLGHVTAVLVH